VTYQAIDNIIAAWASNHTLHLYTKYRDDEVRSVEVVGHTGARCGIYIEPPTRDGIVKVHTAEEGKKRRERKKRHDEDVTIADLPTALERAYTLATEWVGLHHDVNKQ
jgi:hypothetical protein